MNRTIKIELEIPLAQRGNFDVITKGLNAVANDFSIQHLEHLLNLGKVKRIIYSEHGSIKVEYEIFN